MEILIRRISLNGGVISMFVKQHVQCILKITFTHYQKHKHIDMKHKRLCLFNADFFQHFYHLWRLIPSKNASRLPFSFWQDCLFSHKLNFFSLAPWIHSNLTWICISLFGVIYTGYSRLLVKSSLLKRNLWSFLFCHSHMNLWSFHILGLPPQQFHVEAWKHLTWLRWHSFFSRLNQRGRVFGCSTGSLSDKLRMCIWFPKRFCFSLLNNVRNQLNHNILFTIPCAQG